MAKEMLCPTCGTQGKPKKKAKGSIFIELVLWICFIIPGLIYSLWRMSSAQKVCPKCKQPGMIPLDSPIAQKILAQ